jgi:hypothetical protein
VVKRKEGVIMKTYVTFGQDHVHKIGNKVLHKDVVAVLDFGGRERAFELFGRKFSFEYSENCWDETKMRFFPDGYVYIDRDVMEETI